MGRDTFLSDGLTGKRISPATENLQRELRSILQEIRDSGGQSGSSSAGSGAPPEYNILAGPDQVTVTTTSKKLKDLGIVWKNGLRRLTLIPANTNIYWSIGGKAKSGVNLFPIAALEIDIDKVTAEKIQLVTSSSTVDMTVVQEG